MRTCTWALTASLLPAVLGWLGPFGSLTGAQAHAQQAQQPAPQQAPPQQQPQQPAPQYPPPGYPPPQQPPPGYPPPQQPPPGYPPPQQPPPGYPPQYPPQYPPPQYPAYYGAPNYSLPPEPPVRIRRNGFTLGVAIGAGNVQFQDQSHMGMAMQFGIGGMLNRKVGLLFDYSTISHQVDSFASESHDVFGGVAQLFLAEILWVKAGVGLGRLSLSDGWGYEIDRTERSLAGIAGFGVDVIQSPSGFALDLQLRFVGSSYRDVGFTSNTSVLVGFNFY